MNILGARKLGARKQSFSRAVAVQPVEPSSDRPRGLLDQCPHGQAPDKPARRRLRGAQPMRRPAKRHTGCLAGPRGGDQGLRPRIRCELVLPGIRPDVPAECEAVDFRSIHAANSITLGRRCSALAALSPRRHGVRSRSGGRACRRRAPRFDAVLLAPLKVLVDRTLELATEFAGIGRLERGNRIRSTVRDPSVQDIGRVVELHRCEVSLVRHHRFLTLALHSLGQAARFSGAAPAEFIRHVSRLGIPAVRGTTTTVHEDTEAIVAWRNGSS